MKRIIGNILFIIVFVPSVFGGAPVAAQDVQPQPALAPFGRAWLELRL